MKIALSPQWITPKINQQICTSKNIQKDVQNFAVSNSAFSFENRAIFLSFGAIQKINKPEEFNDLDKTAEYLENKIKLSLKEKDEDDIQTIIDSVAQKTNADKELVAETLGRLVQFSSYSQIDNINKQLNDSGIGSFYFSGNFDCNHLFDFLSGKNLFNLKGDKAAYIVDDYNIDWLKSVDKKKSNLFFRMNRAFKNDKMKIFVLDGFSVKVGDKPKSYNLFGADEDLETLTYEIVEEVQKTGKSLDDIFYNDKVASINDVFGLNASVKVIKNPALQEYSAKNIAQVLKPDYPTKEQIKAILKLTSDITSKNSGEDNQFILKLFSTYIDNMLHCYSSESLNDEFKNMYSLIQNKVTELGKTMEDVYYVVPDNNKSFKMITALYSKVNNVPHDKTILNDGKSAGFDSDKVYVILDDFFGSGDSVMGQKFDYYSAIENLYFSHKKDGVNFLFVPVVCMSNAVDNILTNIRTLNRDDNDFVLAKTISNFKNDLSKDLSGIEIMILLQNIGFAGYDDTLSCVTFPYSFPDNNSDLATLFSSFFFPKLLDNENFIFHVDKNWRYFYDFPHALEMVKKECENENK